MSGLERLLQPPWLVVLIVIAAAFGGWLLYLGLPLLARGLRLVANALGRRHDRRTLGWVLATIAMASLLHGGATVLVERVHPDVQYFVFTAGQLFLVVLGVLAIVAFITWSTMFGFHVAGRPLLDRGYLVFVGWHLLRSHHVTASDVREYPGGRAPTRATAIVAGLACAALAWGIGQFSWARWLSDAAVGLPSVRVGLVVAALVLLTWPFRREARAGTIDRFDRLEGRIRALPSLLRVTANTFISIVGVGVGVWALIVVLSVMGGFENDLRSKILATNPHVVIQDEEPMEGIPDLDETVSKLRALDHVVDVIPHVQGDVIVTSRENRNVSLVLRGIDPEAIDASEHHLASTMVSGGIDNLLYPERVLASARWVVQAPPEPEEPSAESDDIDPLPIPGVDAPERVPPDEGLRPGILLGEELANSLRVRVGSEVTVVSPRDDAGFLGTQPRARTFRVAGVFNTGMYEFDLKLAYVRLSEAQRFFRLGGDVNRIELRLSDVDRAKETREAVGAILSRDSLETLDWKQLNRNLFSALALEKIVMFIVLGFIILVASFNVIGSLIMIIMEKSREIAILKSLGATSPEVRRIFLVLGAFVGGIGSSAGLLVGLMTCGFIHYVGVPLPRQYYIEMLPVHVDPTTIASIFSSGIGLCLLATIYPAMEAARINPVEGLRYE